MPAPHSPSAVAVSLGGLALVPFVAGAALTCFADASWHAPIGRALSAYAAVVVAFIGALHWGFAFTQAAPAPRLFVWGVIPAIVAWGAVLSPPRIGLLVHASMLAVCYLVDRATYPKEGVAAWLPLRRGLTVTATLCCLVGAAAS